MNQRKEKVYFIRKANKDSAKPPTLAEAEVLIRNGKIIQFYSVNNLANRDRPEWHYWHLQAELRHIFLPDHYVKEIICYTDKNKIIEITGRI